MTRPRLGKAGFAIAVEVLMLIACLAVPGFRASAIRQQASRAASEIELIRVAAAEAHARTGAWPEDGAPGQAPESLKAFLPSTFRFDRGAYEIDWDHWRSSDGPESSSKSGEYVAVSVITRDPRLHHELAGNVGAGAPHFILGDRVTIVISDLETPMP